MFIDLCRMEGRAHCHLEDEDDEDDEGNEDMEDPPRQRWTTMRIWISQKAP